MSLINGIQHVGLEVDDVERTREFYRLLGLEEIPRPFPPGTADGLWWRASNGQMVHMLVRPVPEKIPSVHFAFDVANLEEIVKVLESNGETCRAGLYAKGAGYAAFVTDPSGNVIELNQSDGLYDEAALRDGEAPSERITPKD